ncbi:MAG: inner-membrane translocator, branched-chain amino acid transport system permease protein [Deltaproteobacteria bacterium CSP1-8]|nr:MAG: inner-membrane translocator, branched-chain amino acid transport system permease protein [Deltaproteobacteria bacterium CSP1-8]
MTFHYFLQLVISGLVIGSIYSAVALGFVIIYKATRVVNFAQGELLMVGAYVCYAFLVQMHVPFWAALLLTILFGMVLAMFVERLILRPMIGEPTISIIMVTIGLSLVLRSLVAAVWGTEILVYEPKLFPQEMVEIAGLPISLEFVWCFILSLVLLAVFSVFFKYSKAGVAMRATAFNQQVAQSMGISVKHIFALSWVISAVVSGIGGVLIGNINGINSSLYHFGLKVFPATILGGLDSILGAAIGGMIIGILENLSDGFCKAYLNLSGVKEVAPYVFLVIILMIKPYGLFGTKEIERV